MIVADEKTALDQKVGRSGAEALLARVRLRSQRRILWLQSRSPRHAEPDFAGLAISPAEVNRLLEDPAEAASREARFYQTDEAAIALGEQIRAADLDLSKDPAWSVLRQKLRLSDFEMDFLTLCVAAGMDPSLLRVYAYLHDDVGACHPSPWLAGCLFQIFPLPTLSPDSALVKWQLATPLEQSLNRWAANTPWLADPYVTLWLLGQGGTDEVLGSAAQFLLKEESARKVCLYPHQLTELLQFVRAVSPATAESESYFAVELEITGPDGAGKRTLAAQLCASLGADLLALDAEMLLPPDLPRPAAKKRIVHAIRMAQLTGALLYWENIDASNPRMREVTDGGSGLMLFGRTSPSADAERSGALRCSVSLPALRAEEKMALWQQHSSYPFPSMIAEWMLTPNEIVKAAQITPEAQVAILDSSQARRLAQNDLFTSMACPFSWDDIVLPPHLRAHLAELEEQVKLRWAVYEEWGYERLCPLGRGITALFCGPSGTGKTMAAQVLARSLGMKLFRVDLSGVMNKYIGETEKRLKQVFDSCEHANVVLLFDEADALFGQRTQVKDAHDRFANIEIDYLLQRMEQFDGVAVLATNRKGDLDKAFVRRIRFILDFGPPGPAERFALWQRVLLPRSPSGEPLLDAIDINTLTQKLSMTGAEITSTALAAAFLARAEGGRISMRHILHAARREMSKNGAVIRIGDWGN